LPSDMQLSMGLIRSGTQRLNHLAEQLVLYAELISGHSKMQLDALGETFELVDIIKDAVALAQQDAAARSVHLKCYFDVNGPVEVHTVQDLMRTAVYEVLRNAVTYSGEGSDVTVQLTVARGEAMVVVTDHGRGIAAEDQQSVWDIMIQSERTKHEQQGAGMGLPIVKQLMALHGGSASLKSEPAKGTVVTLRFPVNYVAGDADRSG
jgi:signal transduction histidine kinase